jgi:polyhydroxyalkanoate synthesis regulator phasin
MWQLGGAVCGGALGFVNNIVSEGAKGLIQDKSKIAKSAEVNTNIGRILIMAGSYIARKGDADPKRFTFISSAIASGTTLVAIATLAAFPGAFFPVVLGTAVSGVISGTLGGAAGVNIANHMAKGPNKGEVAAKNSNQDLLAALMGAPLAMSLSKIATVMGTNPVLLTLGTMGVGLAVCTVMGASATKMEPVTQEKLENIVDQYIKTGQIPEAEQKSWRQNIKSLFHTPSENVSKRITFARSLDEVVGNGKDAAGADGLFPMFNDDHFLLSYHGSYDKINILFKKKAAFNDVARAFTQARLMEMALDGGMFPALQQVCGDRAGKALADLTHRTVPSEMKIDDGMKEKGWHPSAGNLSFEKLDIPNGPATETAVPITLEQFMKLVADPSPEELRKFVMKDDIQDGGHVPAGIEKKTAK